MICRYLLRPAVAQDRLRLLDDGRIVLTLKTAWADGTRQLVFEPLELPGGVWHGKTRAWYTNGRLRYETEWWQGVKHGKFTLWYANGQKRAEGEDRHAVVHGKWTSWAEDGTVTQERIFQAGETGVAASPSR